MGKSSGLPKKQCFSLILTTSFHFLKREYGSPEDLLNFQKYDGKLENFSSQT